MAIEPLAQLELPEEAGVGTPSPARRRSEWLYFALRNTKFMIGFLVVGFALVVALVGPLLVDADPFEFGYGTGLPPSSEHLLGTTAPGQDVLARRGSRPLSHGRRPRRGATRARRSSRGAAGRQWCPRGPGH